MEELEQELNTENQEDAVPKGQYLIFAVDDEFFGMDINNVTEIISMELITIVPDLPVFIKGVINLRGKVIPVMDVRVRFQKEPKGYSDRTCIIVVEIDGTFMGLIIDEVLEVMTINEEEIMQPPRNGKEKESITSRYIWGLVKIGEEVRLLIDGRKLLEKGGSAEADGRCKVE